MSPEMDLLFKIIGGIDGIIGALLLAVLGVVLHLSSRVGRLEGRVEVLASLVSKPETIVGRGSPGD